VSINSYVVWNDFSNALSGNNAFTKYMVEDGAKLRKECKWPAL